MCKRDRYTQSIGRQFGTDRKFVVNRFFETCYHLLHHCLPACLLHYAELVKKLRIPNRYKMVDIFIAGLAVTLIALVTVGIQSIKAALANPVKSLRSE